jgi:hypothetical protein
MDKQFTSQHGKNLEALFNGSPNAIPAIFYEGIIALINGKACNFYQTQC